MKYLLRSSILLLSISAVFFLLAGILQDNAITYSLYLAVATLVGAALTVLFYFLFTRPNTRHWEF